jgi:hypothetical protein
MVTIREAWRHITRDPTWKKRLGLAMLVSLIPYVGGVYIMGWALEFERRVAWGVDDQLPDLGDTSAIGKKAIGAFAVSLAYSLPLLIVVLPVAMVSGFSVPFFAASNQVLTGLAVMAGALVFSMAISLAWLPLYQSAALRFTLFDDVARALEFREVLAIMRRTAGPLWRVTLRVLGLTLAMVGVVLVVEAAVYVPLVTATLRGGEPPVALLALMPVVYLVVFLVVVVMNSVILLVQSTLFGLYGRHAYALPVPPRAA